MTSMLTLMPDDGDGGEPAPRDRGFNLRCALRLHAWEPWGPVESEHFTMTHNHLAGLWIAADEPVHYSEQVQFRTCARCGESQRRKV
jgi:hypothetical protein